MPDYIILSIDNCPYCEKAKAKLTESGLTYVEVNCADNPEVAMLLGAVGRNTFPLVLRTVGGFTELQDMLA